MTTAVKDVALMPAEQAHPVEMFERLAKDPGVDVEKLERLIAMQERIMRHNAKSAFDGAFSRMQAELPEIAENGKILVKGVLRSTFATLEDIHAAIKPILRTYGFAIRHRTEWPEGKAGIIRIVGILSHEQGHSEESCFEAPADKSDYRTDIQSMGSTVSYGRRYTTLDLLNITTRGLDNDGQRKQADPPKAPAGFQQWWDDMAAVTVEGLGRYHAAWKASKEEFRQFVSAHHAGQHEANKLKAIQADKERSS